MSTSNTPNPKVGFIVASEEATNRDKIYIEKPIDLIVLPTFPNNFTFVISFSIFHLYVNEYYTLIISMFDPNGNNLIRAKQEGINVSSRNLEKEEEDEHATVVSMDIKNQSFPVDGDYTVRVEIWKENGEELVEESYHTNEILLPVVKRTGGNE